ncbi:hypothetical protein [Streptomyces sp. rh34]|nr:hypothetical protein [Streptomyces sp. rh34]
MISAPLVDFTAHAPLRATFGALAVMASEVWWNQLKPKLVL